MSNLVSKLTERNQLRKTTMKEFHLYTRLTLNVNMLEHM